MIRSPESPEDFHITISGKIKPEPEKRSDIGEVEGAQMAGVGKTF